MKKTQYRQKPEFILEHVDLKKKKKPGVEMPGLIRTLISIFLVISVFSGSAAVTAWLVFRESTRRKKKDSLL
ncbi:MAG: hypothetical protein ACQES9_10635, partial [Myxococcota bacterium]